MLSNKHARFSLKKKNFWQAGCEEESSPASATISRFR